MKSKEELEADNRLKDELIDTYKVQMSELRVEVEQMRERLGLQHVPESSGVRNEQLYDKHILFQNENSYTAATQNEEARLLRTDLSNLKVSEHSEGLKKAYAEQVQQSPSALEAPHMETDIFKAIEVSNLSASSKEHLQKLVSVRDTPSLRTERAESNRIDQQGQQGERLTASESIQSIRERGERKIEAGFLEVGIANSNLSDEQKVELAETAHHLESTGLSHEPRSLTPDYSAPTESSADRQARVKAMIDKFSSHKEENAQKPKVDPPKHEL